MTDNRSDTWITLWTFWNHWKRLLCFKGHKTSAANQCGYYIWHIEIKLVDRVGPSRALRGSIMINVQCRKLLTLVFPQYFSILYNIEGVAKCDFKSPLVIGGYEKAQDCQIDWKKHWKTMLMLNNKVFKHLKSQESDSDW